MNFARCYNTSLYSESNMPHHLTSGECNRAANKALAKEQFVMTSKVAKESTTRKMDYVGVLAEKEATI